MDWDQDLEALEVVGMDLACRWGSKVVVLRFYREDAFFILEKVGVGYKAEEVEQGTVVVDERIVHC